MPRVLPGVHDAAVAGAPRDLRRRARRWRSIGLLKLFRGFGVVRGADRSPFVVNVRRARARCSADGTFWLLVGFLLMNLLVLLEVADRLSLKSDLEVARDIQQAMLPQEMVTGGRASRRSA